MDRAAGAGGGAGAAVAVATALQQQILQVTQVGRAFAKHYYTMFDTDRAKLVSLYHKASKLTWDGDIFEGPHYIMGKILSLHHNTKVSHAIKSVDCAPSGPSGTGGILVMCCGDMKVEPVLGGPPASGVQAPLSTQPIGSNPYKFTQTFHLMPSNTAAGTKTTFCVINDIFRYNGS
jgi:Nuclear transport factor 2 (NTF2) domain